MNKIYEEKNSSQIMMIAFAIGVVAFLTAIYKYWQGEMHNVEETVILIVAGIIIGIVFYTFHSLTIVLFEDKLQFGFGVFRKTIRKGEIRNIEISSYKFGNYLGYGIRRGLDKSWGYVVGGDRGLMIHLDKQKFFFNTEKPDELMQLIKKQLM